MTWLWSLGFLFGNSALEMAVLSESPLTRWAAQSAEISAQLIPHTFSVYVLKKMLKSRLPNSFVIQSSKLFGFRIGKARARRYESIQRAASRTPSLRRASPALSG